MVSWWPFRRRMLACGYPSVIHRPPPTGEPWWPQVGDLVNSLSPAMSGIGEVIRIEYDERGTPRYCVAAGDMWTASFGLPTNVIEKVEAPPTPPPQTPDTV